MVEHLKEKKIKGLYTESLFYWRKIMTSKQLRQAIPFLDIELLEYYSDKANELIRYVEKCYPIVSEKALNRYANAMDIDAQIGDEIEQRSIDGYMSGFEDNYLYGNAHEQISPWDEKF